MTSPVLRFCSGLFGLASCFVLSACQNPGGSGSNNGAVVDYTSPTRNMSTSEKAQYAFNDAGIYREDWVAAQSGGRAPVREEVMSTDTPAPYVQDDDPAPSHNTASTPPVRKTPFTTEKKSVSETRKAVASGSRKTSGTRKLVTSSPSKKVAGKKAVAKNTKASATKTKKPDTRKAAASTSKSKSSAGTKSTKAKVVPKTSAAKTPPKAKKKK